MKMKHTYVYIYNLKPVDGPLKNNLQYQLQIPELSGKKITLSADAKRYALLKIHKGRARTELISWRILL